MSGLSSPDHASGTTVSGLLNDHSLNESVTFTADQACVLATNLNAPMELAEDSIYEVEAVEAHEVEAE